MFKCRLREKLLLTVRVAQNISIFWEQFPLILCVIKDEKDIFIFINENWLFTIGFLNLSNLCGYKTIKKIVQTWSETQLSQHIVDFSNRSFHVH